MKSSSSGDVLKDLADIHDREAEALAARDAYADAAASRLGHLVAALSELSGALWKGSAASAVARVHEQNGTHAQSTVWAQEIRSAWERQVERLQANVEALERELEERRAVNRSLLMERERERDANERLFAQYTGARRELDDRIRLSNEALAAVDECKREIVEFTSRFDEALALIRTLEMGRAAERDALTRVQTERDEARAAAQDVATALERLRARFEREQSIARDARNAARFVAESDPVEPKRPIGTLSEKVARLRKSLESHAAKLSASPPDVSVIVPTYRNAEMTIDCLQSICDHLGDPPTISLIVVDDSSPNDAISEFAAELPFITFLRNGSNLGFLRSCNRAFSLVTGRYVHFLNNDTLVTAGWLDELVRCADADETIGAVGSMLVYGDGTLQEAGGIIWNDVSGWNYGRGDDADDPRYNYRRDVDYVSGASLLVKSDLFRELDMFDVRYAPAYYEDADLCFAIRERGRRVVYQPKSKVVHLEGVTSGTSLESGVKRHQALNMPKFAEKWKETLPKHYAPATPGIRAARRLQQPRTVVIIDSYVPEPDKDAGSLRLSNIITLLGTLGYSVIFVPANYHRSEPYTSRLQDLGVEVLYHTRGPKLIDTLCERLAIADVVWLCRPDLAEQFMPVLRAFSNVPVIYDTIDLHYVRVRRELEHKGIADPERWAAWEHERELELSAIRMADATITVSEIERETLAEQGIQNVFIIPTVHDRHERAMPFEKTDGIMFIGGYNHTPNVDAALWLCEEIMPIVWRRRPEIVLTIIGSNAPKAILDLEGTNVRVSGYVPDVTPYFEKTRVFVAPLRYGAGLKGKIGHAFSFGVPVVTTAIGAEGFDIVAGRDALVANSAVDLADAIVEAYTDRVVWSRLSQHGTKLIERFGSVAIGERLKSVFDFALADKHRVDRFDDGEVDRSG
jgi:GT2 family glycosyltransferase